LLAHPILEGQDFCDALLWIVFSPNLGSSAIDCRGPPYLWPFSCPVLLVLNSTSVLRDLSTFWRPLCSSCDLAAANQASLVFADFYRCRWPACNRSFPESRGSVRVFVPSISRVSLRTCRHLDDRRLPSWAGRRNALFLFRSIYFLRFAGFWGLLILFPGPWWFATVFFFCETSWAFCQIAPRPLITGK